MSNLWQWRKETLDALEALRKPPTLKLPPDCGGGPEQLGAMTDIRNFLCPEDHATDAWKCVLERWASNAGDSHRSHVLESLHAIAMAVDNGIGKALKKTNSDFVRSADFATIKFFGGPIPLAAGVLGGSEDVGNLADDPYNLDGKKVLVLGFALPGLPWRARPFYPRVLVKHLTLEHRRAQAEAEAAEQQRLADQREQEKQRREQSPEGQIASLQRRLAALECS